MREDRIFGELGALEHLDGVQPIVWPCDDNKRGGAWSMLWVDAI